MRIAVYGGSFNPLHIGHLAILRQLCEMFDRVLLIVSPKNPLKNIDGSTGIERLEAARKALERHPELHDKVEVSDIELTLPQPNYTYITLDTLSQKYPKDEFCLITGGDQIADFRRWKEYRRILLDYGITVFPREGVDATAERDSLLNEDLRYKITIADAPLVTVSSSEIREAVSAGRDISELLM